MYLIRFLPNLAALRRREIPEALPDYELHHIYKLATKNLHLATTFLQLVAKRRPEDFFNFEPCIRYQTQYKQGYKIKVPASA